MPGFAHRSDQNGNALSTVQSSLLWSKQRDDVYQIQLQKFWSELSPQDRHELLRIDKPTLFEHARKNMYCSRCNGLLLEGFFQIAMYGKSLQQEEAGGHLISNRPESSNNQIHGNSSTCNGCCDEIQDPSVHPWGGLTTTRDGSLTLLGCHLYSKSLKALQKVFDSARARERERELLYPDACGGGGRGWISQGMTSYGRGHGTRESCALHTARLSCDTLVDFWSALGEESRQSLLRMKEDDFIERLMYRFDSKRFCRDCRRNVIREFKELKELKRMRREPHCTGWFCVADTAFQYEVSEDTIEADWRQTFTETVATYHHFEWAVGTGEGKSDILEYENVGLNRSVQVSGLDLGDFPACYITLRAWKLDGRCTELSVKAHALRGQQCVHGQLIVGEGYVTISRGESIRSFFERAEEVEEEEDDDPTDRDGNEIDGECSRPQKHAKSPELAREFLLDAATVIFKEQVEKAFREGAARQNAHSVFVSLALKLLEDRVHIACKEIITLEKQTRLLEEEENEKREEEERKERRRNKEREKKLRRKERLKGKDRDKQISVTDFDHTHVSHDVLNPTPNADEVTKNILTCGDSTSEPGELEDLEKELPQTESHTGHGEEAANAKDETDPFTLEQSKYSHQSSKFQKETQHGTLKWSDRHIVANGFDSRYHSDTYDSTPSRVINGSNRQLGMNACKPNGRNGKFHYCSNKRCTDRYALHSCSCNQQNEYRTKADMSKQFYRGNRNGNSTNRDVIHPKQVWEPVDLQKYPRANSETDVDLRVPDNSANSPNAANSVEKDYELNNSKESNGHNLVTKDSSYLTETLTPKPSMSKSSSSENTSSCLSEGDSNTTSTTDSEDASQVSEGGEVSVCTQNDSSEFHHEVSSGRNLSDVAENLLKKNLHCSDSNGFFSRPMASQQQGICLPIHNQNVHFPVFQTPSTMGFYHQNSLSPYANPYMYAPPRKSSPLRMQYGAHPPLFSSGHFPVYHPIAKSNGLNFDDRLWVSKPAVEQHAYNETRAERNQKLQVNESNFSLFHFGGPVSCSAGGNPNYVSSSSDIAGKLSSKFSADYVEKNHKEEPTIEEYNLFAAASNGLRFSIF